MKITKQEIIKAIQEEPLEGGSWITWNKDNTCKVCAVGAVLRKATKLDGRALQNYCGEKVKYPHMANHDIAYLLTNGFYMSALSTFFENTWEDLCDEEGDPDPNTEPEARKRTLNFVSMHFPEELGLHDYL